jgi:hypothetical protein
MLDRLGLEAAAIWTGTAIILALYTPANPAAAHKRQ